jgi:hypothetical protein
VLSSSDIPVILRAGAKHMGTPGRLIIWCPGKVNSSAPLQIDILSNFWPRTGLANIFEGACPNGGKFSKKFFRVWDPEFISTMFLIIPVTS